MINREDILKISEIIRDNEDIGIDICTENTRLLGNTDLKGRLQFTSTKDWFFVYAKKESFRQYMERLSMEGNDDERED
jgi:hypothetical protein